MQIKFLFFLFSLCFITFSNAQNASDTLNKIGKEDYKITNDLGFNSVFLIKQLISNAANSNASTLPTLPYQVIYTMNFPYAFGLRLGLGVAKTDQSTTVSGQNTPLQSNTSEIDLRIGINHNFLKFNKLTCNVFADIVYGVANLKSVNTSTTFGGSGGGSVLTTVTTDEIKSTATGGQIGFGIKYKLNRHIALYTEIPLQYVTVSGSETSSSVTTGGIFPNPTDPPQTKSNNQTNFNFILPTTLYLIINF